MGRSLITSIFLLSSFWGVAQGSDLGWLKGEVRDAKSGEVLPFADIEVLCGPSLWDGVTDFDGQYTLRLPYGPFVLSAGAEGYYRYRTTGIIEPTRMTFLNLELEPMKKLE
ncbi:MAG: carboxypeptidase regulatory-like domain-containing protein [Flavobacteriales bacterium]|nr:carboxypeptidase regulatory-like domain-containing protein [Flavobacteriales bacterium]